MISIGLDAKSKDDDIFVNPMMVEAVFRTFDSTIPVKNGELPEHFTCVRLMNGRTYGGLAPIKVVLKRIEDAHNQRKD